MTTITTATSALVCQRFNVQGMTCHHCELAVADELNKLAGVSLVTVDAAAGIAITESAEPLDGDAVAAAIARAGYQLV